MEEAAGHEVETVDRKKVLAGVLALKKLVNEYTESTKSTKKDLLEDEDDQLIYLQINMKLVRGKTRMISVTLPHKLWNESSEVCFIVADANKQRRREHDDTISHYTEIMNRRRVRLAPEIMPLNKLLTEYKSVEAKRNLCMGFDVFLCDSTICDRVSRFLGKEFVRKRKFMRRVNIKRINLRKEFQNALSTVVMNCGHGTTSTFEIGRCSSDSEDITENIMKVCDVLNKKAPGGWENINSLFVKTAKSMAIPIYLSMRSHSGIKLEDEPSNPQPIIDELTTLSKGKVEVYPDGSVKVVGGVDPDDVGSDYEDEGIEEEIDDNAVLHSD